MENRSLVPRAVRNQLAEIQQLQATDIPGKEVLMRPLPIDSVLEVAARAIERVSARVYGAFSPYQSMDGYMLVEVFHVLNNWSQEKLLFGMGWHYEFSCVYDALNGEAFFEVSAVKSYTPVKLQWVIAKLDSFDPMARNDIILPYNNIEFIEVLRSELEHANRAIDAWNATCRSHKPFFTHPLPYGVIEEEVLEMGRRTLLPWEWQENDIGFTEADVYWCFSEVSPIRFGPWIFHSIMMESNEWIRLECILKNEHLEAPSFLLCARETRTRGHDRRMPLYRFPEKVDQIIDECEMSMVRWNEILFGEVTRIDGFGADETEGYRFH